MINSVLGTELKGLHTLDEYFPNWATVLLIQWIFPLRWAEPGTEVWRSGERGCVQSVATQADVGKSPIEWTALHLAHYYHHTEVLAKRNWERQCILVYPALVTYGQNLPWRSSSRLASHVKCIQVSWLNSSHSPEKCCHLHKSILTLLHLFLLSRGLDFPGRHTSFLFSSPASMTSTGMYPALSFHGLISES